MKIKVYLVFVSLFLMACSTGMLKASEPGTGVSGMFVLDVKDPVVNLINPSGGEILNIAAPLQVAWSAEDDNLLPNSVSIRIIVSPDNNVHTLLENAGPSGSQQLNLPSILTSQAVLQVSASDLFGNTGFDQTVGYITLSDGTTNTPDVQEDAAPVLLSYPNPANGMITLEYESEGHLPSMLYLVNMSGQIIKHQSVDQSGHVVATMDTSGLPPGMYILRLERNSKMLTSKIIVR